MDSRRILPYSYLFGTPKLSKDVIRTLSSKIINSYNLLLKVV